MRLHLGPPSRKPQDDTAVVFGQISLTLIWGLVLYPSSALEVLGALPSGLILGFTPGSGSPMPLASGLPRRSAETCSQGGAGAGVEMEQGGDGGWGWGEL